MSENDGQWKAFAMRLARELDRKEVALRETKAKLKKTRAEREKWKSRWEKLRESWLGRRAMRAVQKSLPETETESGFVLPEPVPVAFSVPVAKPEISVIIPVHNQVRFTAQCLNSLEEIGCRFPYEVIVVDDGSTDETPQFLGSCSGIRVERQDPNGGFIAACNRGAAVAKGEWLVFLNNDTTLHPGWLEALRSTFVRHPAAGMAGAKLVYPDGRLQEAGGRIFCDGSAANIGHGADPDAPEYQYVREVDYCSAAAVMIPAEIFTKVGGFDSAFAPCYYEDVDLAFRVRAAGRKIYYQPEARVTHFEGATAGRDLSVGPKQHQRANRLKFLERWMHELMQRPAPDDPAPKRILILDDRLPGESDAGAVRLHWLARILTGMGVDLCLLTPKMYDSLELRQEGLQVIGPGKWKKAENYLEECASTFSHIVLCRLKIMKRFHELVRKQAPNAQLIYDTIDLHFLREEREARLSGSAEALESAKATRETEVSLMRAADQTWVVSEFERELLNKEVPGVRVEVVPLIQPVEGLSAPFEDRSGWLFVGGFRHKPNVDAMEWYLREIHPLVSERLPEATCYIVGADAPESLTALAAGCNGVTVTGFVPDIAALISKVRFTIAPLRYGAGVKGKVNLSLSLGVPVIGTSMAFEGTALVPGRDVLVADSAEAFAKAMSDLYPNQASWQALSDNGLETLRTTVSPEQIRSLLASLLS